MLIFFSNEVTSNIDYDKLSHGQGFGLVVREQYAMNGLGKLHVLHGIYVEKVDGLAHYLPSFEPFTTGPWWFLGYKQNIDYDKLCMYHLIH